MSKSSIREQFVEAILIIAQQQGDFTKCLKLTEQKEESGEITSSQCLYHLFAAGVATAADHAFKLTVGRIQDSEQVLSQLMPMLEKLLYEAERHDDGLLAARNLVAQHSAARWNSIWENIDSHVSKVTGVAGVSSSPFAATLDILGNEVFASWTLMRVLDQSRVPTLHECLEFKAPEDLPDMPHDFIDMYTPYAEWVQGVKKGLREAILKRTSTHAYPSGEEFMAAVARGMEDGLGAVEGSAHTVGMW